MNIYLIIVLAVIAVMSLVAYITYCIDKKRAVKGQWRVPEKVLLLMALCGGAVGATIAMYTIRHKNRKWYFVATNVLSLLLHIAVVVWVALI